MVETEGNAQKMLEKELQELDRQRMEVEHRIRELESKERGTRPGSLGRSGGIKRSRDDVQQGGFGRGRTEFRSSGGGGRFNNDSYPNKRMFVQDEKGGAKITSTVVKVTERDPEKPQPTLNTESEDDKKRNRKMFGFLLGTLQQFKKEVETKTDVENKRHEVEQKIESKVEKERQELVAERQKIINEQKEREIKLKEEIKKRQEETELAILEQKWAKHNTLLNMFHKTKSKPAVYYAFNPAVAATTTTTTTTAAASTAAASTSAAGKEGEEKEKKRRKRGEDSESESESDSESSSSSSSEEEKEEKKPQEKAEEKEEKEKPAESAEKQKDDGSSGGEEEHAEK